MGYKTGFVVGIVFLLLSLGFGIVCGTSGIAFPQGIVLHFRITRVIAALIVGSSLSVVGLTLQSILKNPLADPYILGISGGAALFGTFSLLLPIPVISFSFFDVDPVFFFSFIGGIVTVFLIQYLFLRKKGRFNSYTLLLAGFAINAGASSIILFIKSLVVSKRTQEIIFWLVGNFSDVRISWKYLIFYLMFYLPGIIILYFKSNELNALSLGDSGARGLGISPEKIKKIVFTISSLIVAISVSLVGMIGFIGIIVPQAVRMVFGADLKFLFPLSLIFGASFLIVSDSFSRLMFTFLNTEIPVGVISSLIGAPLFVYLLLKMNSETYD